MSGRCLTLRQALPVAALPFVLVKEGRCSLERVRDKDTEHGKMAFFVF